jgi:ELWxxDGT repeat protein
LRKLAVLALLGSLIAVPLSAGAPYLVRDLNVNPSMAGSYPGEYIRLGSLALLLTHDESGNARELWRTDGTTAGTFRLGGRPESVVVWNGKAWFTTGPFLWSTDGTVAGTQKLTLPVESPAILPTHLMAGVTHLYFFNAGRLWRTDGTTAGTAQMSTAVFTPGRLASELTRPWTATVGTTFYFLAALNDGGSDLWKIDGTGTPSLVKDFSPAAATANIAVAGNLVYLNVYSSSLGGQQVWRSDGTTAGTYALKAAQTLRIRDYTDLVPAGALLYFVGDDGTGLKLWRTNGTDAGTVAVASSLPGAASIFDAAPLGRLPNGTILFNGPDLGDNSFAGTWAYDGTNVTYLATTQPLFELQRKSAVAGSIAYFTGSSRLWRSDGTIGGTYPVGSSGADDRYAPGSLDTRVVFGAWNEYGVELWQSDGTDVNTTMVKDLMVQTFDSVPDHLTPFRGGILFDAVTTEDPFSYERRDLIYSDGTAAGTETLVTYQDAGAIVPCGTRAFFPRTTPETGTELWITDGTAAGTALLKEITPGSASGSPHGLTCLDGVVLFYAHMGANDKELWRTDGTAAGTLPVKSFRGTSPNVFTEEAQPIRFGHRIYFAVRSDGHGRLWRSDGTAAGTEVVKHFADSERIIEMTAAGSYLYVVTRQISGAYTLWRSDGTPNAAGTVALVTGSGITYLRDFYGRLTYQRSDWDPDLNGICTTDGTGAGTCFQPAGRVGSYVSFLGAMNGRMYYNASELRSTDGLSELRSGVERVERVLTIGGGRLYSLRRPQPVQSWLQLSESDGTLAGTQDFDLLVDESTRAAAGGGGRIFISNGELYALETDVAAIAFSPESVPSTGGTTVTITGRGFTAPATIRVGSTVAITGTITPTSITFTAPPLEAGFYDLDVTLGDGRRLTLVQPLRYTCTAPTAAITTAPTTVCAMTPVPLQGSGGARCSWFPATGLNDPSSCNPTATPATTQTYSLIVYNDAGCASANYPSVTVTVVPAVSAVITLGTATPLQPNKSYTASVPEAGAGATYAWTMDGGSITGGAATRTVTFTTSCARAPRLNVTVTNASGCSATSGRYLDMAESEIIGVTPRVVNPGTTVTLTGTGLACVVGVNLLAFDGTWSRSAAFTLVNDTVTFRGPADAPRDVLIDIITAMTAPDTADSDGYHSAVRRDFADDGRADVFWRNATTGQTAIWFMKSNGTYTPAVSPTVAAPWQPAAFGDFDGDARADVFWFNPSSGETSIWLMNGATITTAVRSIRVPLPWAPVSSADFNGDGRADLFWQNPNTGETSVWFMNGTAVTSVRSMTVPATWKPVAFGDFNVDGKSDIFWRNPTSGETSIWLMNGGMPGTTVRSDTLASPWTVGGSADFDGDRKDDLLWYNPSTGASMIWRMDGVAVLEKPAGPAMPGYVPAVVSHFALDQLADVLWHNPTTGDTSVWLRTPTATTTPGTPMRVDVNWRPVTVP